MRKEELATMLNKKLKIFSLAFISMMALTSCDEIMAKPTGYKDDVVMENTNDQEIYNNLMKLIYDEIHKDNIGSNVLEKVLYQYAVSIFGPYDIKVKGYKEDDITLQDAKADSTKIDDFVKSHKAYWTVNSDGKRVDDNQQVVADDANASASERARVAARFKSIEERVAKKIYKDISTGSSYSDRNIFSEEKFLMSLRHSLYKVANPNESGVTVFKGLLLPSVEDVDIFNPTTGLLDRENYWSLRTDGTYGPNTYVEDEIIPTIYREMLVEQYIYDTDKDNKALGHAKARKVNIVAIKSNSDYPLAARYLVEQFINDYVTAAPIGADNTEVTTVADSVNKVDLDTLKILSNAWKGAELTQKESDLLTAAGLEYDDALEVYKPTDYAKVLEQYNKIYDNPALTDTSIESDFTGSGTYEKETGLLIKTRGILLEDYTQTGWYISNGGLTDLPESIRSRLFNVGVANAMSEDPATEAAQDRWQYKADTATWTYGKDDNESPYLALINGRYYLKSEKSKTETDNPYKDVLIHDKDSSTYYIIQVVEAASSSKLSKTNENRYEKTRPEDAEKFVTDICEIVAKGEQYSTLSTKHWLEESKVLYHDQEVYDYFKTNYPELFD